MNAQTKGQTPPIHTLRRPASSVGAQTNISDSRSAEPMRGLSKRAQEQIRSRSFGGSYSKAGV